MNEWNFWQIPHVGVPEPDRDDWARDDVFTTIRRAADMKMSNFGALWVGIRMDDDYTRTELTYISKDELSDLNVITADDGAPYGDGLRGTTATLGIGTVVANKLLAASFKTLSDSAPVPRIKPISFPTVCV